MTAGSAKSETSLALPISVDAFSALTSEDLNSFGIPIPAALATAHIPLWRGHSKHAMHHWTETYCRHRRSDDPNVHVPVLDFPLRGRELCSCVDEISISDPVDTFVEIAAEVCRAEHWIAEGHDAAAGTSTTWTDFARWRARQPLQGGGWLRRAEQVKGGGCTPAGRVLRKRIPDLQARAAEIVTELARRIPTDAGQSALLNRTVAIVGDDRRIQKQSATIARISTCPGPAEDDYWFPGPRRSTRRLPGCPTEKQPDPWTLVAALWIRTRQSGEHPTTKYVCDGLDVIYPCVHDLRALDCDASVEPRGCLHTWAADMASHHRRTVVQEWLHKLDTTWEGLGGRRAQADTNCTHLLLAVDWPWAEHEHSPLAYLTQFDFAAGPITRSASRYAGETRIGVLRVPEWAALHASQQFPDMRSEPIDGAPLQALTMLRIHGFVPITGDEFAPSKQPSDEVSQERAERDAATRYGPDWTQPYRYDRPLQTTASPSVRVPGVPRIGKEWHRHTVLDAMAPGSGFVYGSDNLALLALGFGALGRYNGYPIQITVELQSGCRRHPDSGVHICDVTGALTHIGIDGAVTFIPDGLIEPVTVPPNYLVDLQMIRWRR